LTIRKRLLDWYRVHKRDLPWRATKDPYRIWVSEVMLQQTRAAAAIPFYLRFLDLFPTVERLAGAREQDVLAAWAGLGYYSRARNLQKAAKIIQRLGGFPKDYETIRSLPGVGDYTAAAVASIAFDLPHAVLDGNVARVLSRVTADPGSIQSPKTRNRLRDFATANLPRSEIGEFNQAMMELGATICLPKDPRCLICPIASLCVARQTGRQAEFPVKAPRKEFKDLNRPIYVVRRKGCVLCWQHPSDSKRLAGFWELPGPEQLPAATRKVRLGEFQHTIVQTRYACEVWEASARAIPEGLVWLDATQLKQAPLSTTARKALALVLR
jgi:A/G-specific adenine glycosylase